MALAWLLATVGCAEPPAARVGLRAERAAFADARWDEGNAEVARYRVRERRYGTLRDGAATLIVVKETFDALRLVKADLGTDHPLEVMKLNHLLTTPTGVYTYRQMASVFLRRADARPVKLVTSSQEWCGITSKQLFVRGPESVLRASSYFGAEGERADPVQLDARTVLFDALPLWLRSLDLDRVGRRAVQLLPAQLSSHAQAPRIAPATIEVAAPRTLDVPAGRFEGVPVTVVHDGGEDTFVFDAVAPHTLLRWERADGGHYELEWVRYAPYWRLTDEGDTLVPAPRVRAEEGEAAAPPTDVAGPSSPSERVE